MAEVMFRRSTICATTGQRPSKKGRLYLQTSTEHEPGAIFRWAPDIGCTYPSLCRALVIADISLLVPGKVHGRTAKCRLVLVPPVEEKRERMEDES